jgi:nitrate reductase molybdenum cofactor assembly chaperone NarJ/NarW
VSRRPGPFGRRRTSDWRVVHQVAACLLGYPDSAALERVPLLREALAEQPGSEPVDRLTAVLDHLAATPPDTLRESYVELFDLHRSQTLYLSYWTDGDTRRRGETLASFKQHYRDSAHGIGHLVVDTRGELPDFLPMVLEYAALADPVRGAELLQEYRPSLELIRLALLERRSPYADVLVAVCGTLPGESPQDRAAVMRMAQAGPPAEAVGLDVIDLQPTRTRDSTTQHPSEEAAHR